MWIVIAQVMMVTTLMATLPVNFTTEVKLFTILILIHNVFGATQDVAIDALAVGTLREDERGLANGLMFGGAYLGQAIGGAGVLLLAERLGSFQITYFFVAACILFVTIFVALPMREPKGPPEPPLPGSRLAHAGKKIVIFVWDSIRAFLGTRGAFVGLLFALMPAGAYALGLALFSNLAVELGLTDGEIAKLNLFATLISATGCVVGGWLSDRLGRKRMLAIYLVGTAIPTAYLAWAMSQAGWIMPVDPLHGRHYAQGSGHPVHNVYGHLELCDQLQRHLAGAGARQVGLSDHPDHRQHRRAVLHRPAAAHGCGQEADHVAGLAKIISARECRTRGDAAAEVASLHRSFVDSLVIKN
jgi:PAT family beta-lactamase induction signal transducer AmpG